MLPTKMNGLVLMILPIFKVNETNILFSEFCRKETDFYGFQCE